MAKFREIIVKSINVQAGKYTDINDQLHDFLAHEIYLVPKEDGEHDRFVSDKNGVVSKQATGKQGDFIPLTGTEQGKPVTGDILLNNNVRIISNSENHYGWIELSNGNKKVNIIALDLEQSKLGGLEIDARSVFVKGSTDDYGIIGNQYFGSQYESRSFVQKKYVDDAIAANSKSVYKVRGSVPNLDVLNGILNPQEGDVYNVLDSGDNYVYVNLLNGTNLPGWDKLSGVVDASDLPFVPISGTKPDVPITGMLEFSGNQGLKKYYDASGVETEIKFKSVGGSSDGIHLTTLDSNSNYSASLQLMRQNISLFVNDLQNSKYANVQLDPSNGLHSFYDYSAINNPLAFVQQKYVENKLSTFNLQNVLDNGGYAYKGLNSLYIDLNNGGYNAEFFHSGDVGTRFTQNTQEIVFTKYYSNITETTIVVQKGGLKYGEDYSQRPEFGDRNLVDKGYVDTAISNIGSGNSLPLSGTEIGNPLTGDIQINNNDDYFQRFYTGDLNTGFKALTFEGNELVKLQALIQGGGNTFGNNVAVGTGNIQIDSGFSNNNGDVSSSSLTLTGANITISHNGTTDPAEKRGLRGQEDYSANIQSLDYVQKIYADTKAIPTTVATNSVNGQESKLILRNGILEGELAHMRIKGTWTIASGESVGFGFEGSKSVRIGSQKITLFDGTNLKELIIVTGDDGSSRIYNLGDAGTFTIDQTFVGWYTGNAA